MIDEEISKDSLFKFDFENYLSVIKQTFSFHISMV